MTTTKSGWNAILHVLVTWPMLGLLPTGIVFVPAMASGELISVDFLANESGGSSPISGDTTIAAGPKQNAEGLIFTGQVGAWNGLDVAPSQNLTYTDFGPSGPLTNGQGDLTTVTFEIDGTYRGGSAIATDLRSGHAGLEPGVGVGTSFDWIIDGLTSGGSYNLAVFGSAGSGNNNHIANGMAGIQDSEGDWNWLSIIADGSGRIVGTFTVAGSGTPTGFGNLFGFQLESIEAVPEPGALVLALVACTGMVLWMRRRR